MGEVKNLPKHQTLPTHILSLIDDGAWGRVGQALQDGLSANLRGADGETLFGFVLFALSEQGPEHQTSAAYGPLALLETFLAKGLHSDVNDTRTTITDALAFGQWHWVPRLIDAGHALEVPKGRSPLFALLEGRMMRRLHGLEDQDLENDTGPASSTQFNPDTQEEARAIYRVVALLASKGVDLEALDDDEDAIYPTTPLILSVMYNDLVMAEALLSAGASVCAPWEDQSEDRYMSQMHPMALAAKGGSTQLLDLILSHVPLDLLDLYGSDALHVAASKGHVECLKVLEAHGVPFEAPSRSGGFRALHQASLHGQKEVIDHLLGLGDKLNVPSETGVMPSSVLNQYHPELARLYGVVEGQTVIPMRPR